MSKGRILIVDDDVNAAQLVSRLLRDEGFDVTSAVSGRHATHEALMIQPDVILLELWIPDQDGMETLRQLRRDVPETAVVMMSGYGSLQIAVKAMQLGAVDYLEKPLTANSVVKIVQRAMLQRQLTSPETYPQPPMASRLTHAALTNGGAPPMPAAARLSESLSNSPRQRTLSRSVVLQGQGLQSGAKTGFILSPLPSHQGIQFRDMITRECLTADVKWVNSTQFCTSLSKCTVQAKTIEHLMSALHAYQISNVLITLEDEIPIMDGSALAFCELIEAAGIVEQEAEAECFVVDQCYQVKDVAPEGKCILIEPYDGFRITYRVSYPPPILIQEWTYEHYSGAGYHTEIAPARTFGFVKDVEAMHDAGLIPGGRLNNVILLGDGRIVNTTPLRFADEFVRHKILDIMGDFYLLGQPIRGHIRANMTGHTDNIELVRQLQMALAVA